VKFWDHAINALRSPQVLPSWEEHRAALIMALEFLRCDGIPNELVGDVLSRFNTVVERCLPGDDMSLQTFVGLTRESLEGRAAATQKLKQASGDERPYIDPDGMREQQRPPVSP